MASSAATPIAVADTVYTKTDGTVSASKFDRTGTMYKVRIVIDSPSSLSAFLPRLEFVHTLRLIDMRIVCTDGHAYCTVQLSLHLGQWQERIFSLSIKKKTLYYFRSQAEYKQFIDFGIPRLGAVQCPFIRSYAVQFCLPHGLPISRVFACFGHSYAAGIISVQNSSVYVCDFMNAENRPWVFELCTLEMNYLLQAASKEEMTVCTGDTCGECRL